MRGRRPWATVLLTLILLCHGCASRAVKPRQIGEPYSPNRVLIATQYSEFKEAVVTRILESFKCDPVYFKVIGVRELKHESTEQYKAVVISNACMAWHLNAHVANFLNRALEREKIIVLSTANSKNWRPKAPGIDAITSASNMANVESVADIVVHKVRLILSSHPS